MAAGKTSSTRRRSNTSAKSKSSTSAKGRKSQAAIEQEKAENFRMEVILWIVVAVCLLLLISNFGVGGTVGNAVSGFIFGLFGVIAYIFPIVLLIGTFFGVSNKGNRFAVVKIVAAILFVSFFCMFMGLVVSGDEIATPLEAFQYSRDQKAGGGILGGWLAYVISNAFGKIGAYIIDVIVLIISLVLITERSAMKGVQKGSRKVYESAMESHEYHKQEREKRRMDRRIAGVSTDTRIVEEPEEGSDEISELRADPAYDLPPVEPESAVEPIVAARSEEVARPVTTGRMSEINPTGNQEEIDTYSAYAAIDDSIIQGDFSSDDVIHKIEEALREESRILDEPTVVSQERHVTRAEGEEVAADVGMAVESDGINVSGMFAELEGISVTGVVEEPDIMSAWDQDLQEPEEVQPQPIMATSTGASSATSSSSGLSSASRVSSSFASVQEEQTSQPEEETSIEEQIQLAEAEMPREYVFPVIDLLKPGNGKKNGNTQQELKETAVKLQQCLQTFGVNVTVTNISCGPAVTRYEIQPEMGVKVSKIVNLADDIKLNLAAADIRIEAPIPGKAAVGIEVPNKENVMVPFRELIESEEFEKAESKISFAVGKDIAGKVTVTDIAKMPHVLIAGATGSGKSVCINTIIMSILYKADPKDVKLIMIDPKVVELSVYNGIPHLMIPVVTDPKKAAGALNWAVQEMTDRYNKFAESGVRKIDEYNAKVRNLTPVEGAEMPKTMPQIVIIVDELADLMMVASREVEDAICRLAQLARAAGIHLVIATQRPSVNVITGLIKANMPSRIAFAVTSGVDSRTILDMNGAEKLLGKGDMLFSPQSAPKPIRIQGAFISDQEVSDVVNFIKENNGMAQYNSDVQQKMESMESSGNQTVSISDAETEDDGRDAYFMEAAKIIIDKEKASIGMLQRYLKVGFNRAARIMDQMEEAGIVGPEEGTKPRKVLMTPEEFEQISAGEM